VPAGWNLAERGCAFSVFGPLLSAIQLQLMSAQSVVTIRPTGDVVKAECGLHIEASIPGGWVWKGNAAQTSMEALGG